MEHKKCRGLKIAIIILAILLALNLIFLTVIYVYNVMAPTTSITAVVSDNVLTPKDDVSSDGSTVDNSFGYSSDTEPISSDNMSTSTSDIQPNNPVSDFSFYNRHAEYNTPFRVVNMFPGDTETKHYSVKVTHKSSIVLHFGAEIRDGYEKLAEVLNCRVVLSDNGELLYDGLMRDMPESLEHLLITKNSVTDYVDYDITAYLNTSVGNEYMNQDLYADFRFWADEADMTDLIANGIYDPEYLNGQIGENSSSDSQHWYDKAEDLLSAATGDNSPICIFIIVAVCSLFLLILLSVKLKKEGTHNEKQD